MNDRFKFRIWDKIKECFVVNPINYGELYLDLNGKLRFAEYPQGNGDNSSNSVFDPIGNQDDYIITQWTGAVDKNKKEVYEGDVIKVRRCFVRPFINDDVEIDYNFTEGEEEIGYVFWYYLDNKFCVSYEHIHYDDSEDFDKPSHRIEVIGNIFENPTLVKYEW